MKSNIDAIIVAAGESSRFKAKLKKQFYPINNIPLIIHTIRNFLNYKKIKNIILVISGEDYKKINIIIKEYKIENRIFIVEGGQKRAQSVYNGIKNSNADYVFIHDGARPYIDKQLLNNLIKNHIPDSIVIPVIKSYETIRYRDEKRIKLIDREKVFMIQTPQFVNRMFLISAMHYYMKRNKFFTDEAEYIYRKKGKLIFINGLKENIKITNKSDIDLIEYFFNERRKK